MFERRAMVAEDSLLILVALEILLEQHGIAISGQASAGATAPVNSSTATTTVRIKKANPSIA